MKKLFTLVAALLLAATVWAQSCPQKISYQAVVRNQANQLVVGTSGIQVTVTIKEGTTTKYVETHNVTSNQNGLISLTVGEGTAQAPYTTMENIDWSNATMVTVVAVPGEAPVEAITPVTAVPYALYSCEINPGSKTITNIYEHIGDTLNNYYTKSETKVQIASDIHDSIVNNISTQIHDTVMNHLTEYQIQDCDDVVACPVIERMRDSIQLNRDTIRTIVANLRDTINKTVLDSIKYYNSEMNLAIDTIVKNIVHDSIVNNISTQIHDTVMNHLTEYEIKNCNDVQNCVAPQISDSLVNYLTIDGLCDSIKNNCSVAFTDERNVFTKRNRFQRVVILEKGAVQPDGTIATTDSLNSVNGKDLANYTGKVIHDSIVNKISNQIHDTVMNHLNEYEIKNCEDVNKCVVEGLRTQNTTINNVVDSLVMKNVLDSISVNTSKINNAIDTIVDNRAAKQWMDVFTVSTAEQVEFTISKTPKSNTLVKMYINGVMVGGYTAGMTSTVITVEGTTVTYNPNNNLDACSAAYKLKAGDRVIFEYWY